METTIAQHTTQQANTIPTRKRDRKRLLRQFPGLIRAVARRHRVSAGTVSRVFHGEDTSARVRAAILAEMERRMKGQAQ